MSKSKILIQLDPDPQPSSFDSIVAIDSGVDHLLTYGNVTPNDVEGLVHGAMFTRGPVDLKHTALFFGGSNVQATEQLVKEASKCFFGPLRVSWMSDPNGSNTTAAAAVLSAERHGSLDGKNITILGGTGPVGQRIAQIIVNQSALKSSSPSKIHICSRQLSKAASICQMLQLDNAAVTLEPFETLSPAEGLAAVYGAEIVFAAGAAGIELLPADWLELDPAPQVLVDLNAVPPAGIAGVDVMDKANTRGSTICYGAIGVGGLKMKIHKRSIASLFESNALTLGVREIYEIGRGLI
jgi:hypothetical protein